MNANAATQPVDIALDQVGMPDNGILVDSVRPWRSDCQAGQFKVGATTLRGNKLDMEIVGAQFSHGEYFAYPPQTWLAVLFVDPDGVLASILFKTESLDNFEELRRQYRLKGETLLGKVVRATMSRRASRAHGESYYAIEFEVVNEGRFARQIAEFRAQHLASSLYPRLATSKKKSAEGQGETGSDDAANGQVPAANPKKHQTGAMP